jgi:hypothetical protein
MTKKLKYLITIKFFAFFYAFYKYDKTIFIFIFLLSGFIFISPYHIKSQKNELDSILLEAYRDSIKIQFQCFQDGLHFTQ